MRGSHNRTKSTVHHLHHLKKLSPLKNILIDVDDEDDLGVGRGKVFESSTALEDLQSETDSLKTSPERMLRYIDAVVSARMMGGVVVAMVLLGLGLAAWLYRSGLPPKE